MVRFLLTGVAKAPTQLGMQCVSL